MAKTISKDELLNLGTTNAIEGVIVTDKTPLDEAKEQAEATLERLRTILAEGDAEAFAATADEAETEISAIKTSWKGGTAAKKELRGILNALKDEAEAQTKAEAAAEGAVVLGTHDWHEVISDEEFNAAVTNVKDAVSLHLKSGEAAKQVSAHLLDARLKVRDRKGNVDLRGNTQPYRDYATSVYAAAGEALGIQDNAENREVLKRLQDSTGYYMSDRVVTLARELTAEDFRDKFPQVAEAQPELEPFAALVAEKIVPEKSKREAAIERQQRKALEAKAAEAGEAGEDEDAVETGAPEETIYAAALKASTALIKATTAMVKVPVADLEEEHRAELEAQLKAVEAKVKELRKALI